MYRIIGAVSKHLYFLTQHHGFEPSPASMSMHGAPTWLPGAEECSVLDACCQCLTLFAEQIINSPASTTKEHFLYLLLHIASLPNHQELLPRLTQALKSLTVSYLQQILQECVAIPLPHLVSSLVQFQLARLWQQNYSARRDGHKARWIQAAQFWGILCSLYPQVPCPARDLSMSLSTAECIWTA